MSNFDYAGYYDQHSVLINWLFTGSLLMAIIGYFVARLKGQGCLGCGLGCLLGPFGVLIAALLPDRRV